MKTVRVEVAVIGAGTAGLGAYHAAIAAGARTAIIEEGDYGTTCARVGCMPSKLLIAAADAAYAIGKATDFGILVDGVVRTDGHAVMNRLHRERDRFVGFVLREMQAIPAENLIRGHASFVNNHLNPCSLIWKSYTTV